MKKSLLVLVSICCLCLLSACGSGATGGSQTATHFSIAAPATATAGTAISLSVNALDASNNVVTRYSGTVHFTSTDAQAAVPANSTLTNGAGTFSATLKTAGGQTITATDTVAGSITGTSTSISVIGATHFSVAAPATATAGTAISLSVNALDASNNVMPRYSGTVHFTSTDAQAAVPANSTLTNGAGTFSATLKTLGNQTITATDTATASVTGNSGAISVGSAAPTHFSVKAQLAANPGTSLSFSVTALDAANNPATTYSGTVHFTSTDSLASIPVNSPLTNGTGNFSATLNTVGSQTITAADTVTASITGVSNSIKIAKLTITSGTPANGTVGGAYGTQQCYSSPGFLLTASGGNPGHLGKGYVWSSTSLPPGLQIGILSYAGGSGCFSPSPAAPFIFGTPNQAGTFNNVVITVHDMESPPATASSTYTITINAAAAASPSAEALSSSDSSTSHHHYKLIDMGTFGGPQSGVNGEPSVNVINSAGTVVGVADTSGPTPVPGCFNPIGNLDCFISHAFVWRGEGVKDLGTLPGGNYSFAAAINQRGQIAGTSENDQIDPVSGNPEFHAVLWQNDKILDLGTLGGTASFAATLNDRGQVIGEALNDVPDPLSILGLGDGTTLTQTRAFLWERGKMLDLGTLGGADSWAMFVNDRGQVAGTSFTTDVVDPNTGAPQSNAFLWEDGKMKDLGNLGGTNGFLGPQFVEALNNRGQVVGLMALPGEQIIHPFLWDGEKLSDLGSFGGSFSTASGINDAGEVVGYSYFSGDLVKHAFLWKNGVMTDLGTVGADPCSFAYNINSKGQIVGGSQNAMCDPFTHAVLWENGEPGVDLNTLIPSNTNLQLIVAYWINDRGEIVGLGHDPTCPNGDSCDAHAFVLIPCDENHSDVEGCDYDPVSAETAAQVRQAQIARAPAASPNMISPAEVVTRFRSMMAHRNRRFGAWQRQ